MKNLIAKHKTVFSSISSLIPRQSGISHQALCIAVIVEQLQCLVPKNVRMKSETNLTSMHCAVITGDLFLLGLAHLK